MRRLAGRPPEEFEAHVDGTAGWPPRGDQGFGYDPMFCPTASRTFGEMSSEEKHSLPPRGAACRTARAPSLKLAEACLELLKTPTPWRRKPRTTRRSASTSIGRSACPNVPYCDFNSHVRRAPIDEGRFVRAFPKEITATGDARAGAPFHDLLRRRHTVADAAGDHRGVLNSIARQWRVAPDAEITLEANPTSVEATRFRGYRAAGVNRVSLGVQALDDACACRAWPHAYGARSARCGRGRARDVRSLLVRSHLRAAGANAGRHGASELKRALAEAAEHLSLYQLTIEPETPFAALHAAGKLKTPDDDMARALYDTTQEICAAHGLPAYEISNHARPGGECRHNLIYWRAHEYAGIGPGAHGRLDIDGTATPPRPKSGRRPG